MRAVGLLNARKVETLTEPGRHADGGNLYLSISTNGGKRWVFLYTLNGKRREMGLGNWPIQSCGSDIMRWAVIRCADAGIRPVATVHDALVFHVPTSQARKLLELVRREMESAAEHVLGEPIAVDVDRTDWPNNYMDEDGSRFYRRLQELLDKAEEAVA